MRLLDKAKKALKGHGDKVESGIDKAADVVDDKTGHKYTENIDTVAENAKGVVEKLDTDGGGA